MRPRRVIVCEAQVPFVEGGAEYHVRELVRQLRGHGFATELVSVPFKWYPKEEILTHAAAWRLLDLSESNGMTVDLVIGTKFPSYFARHPRKVAWLIHQYRAAYELAGTRYSDFDHVEGDVGLQERLVTLDRQMLGECARVFSNACNTANRLARYNGIQAEPLYHPPRLAERLVPGPYGNYILSVGRIESVKRVDFAVRAMARIDQPIRLVIAGDGTQRANTERLVDELGVRDRIDFLGTVDDDQLVDLYANALAVIYAPFDEDFGYVTLEAFLARKPVITCHDSGGVLEFVQHEVNGIIVSPDVDDAPAAIADAVNRFHASPALAASFGDAGYERARGITWDGVIDKLVGTL
jgi:glycosyltransferase involved in cell wall biosynthesis